MESSTKTITAISANWLSSYKNQNNIIFESKPMKKNSYYNVSLFDTFLNTSANGIATVEVNGAKSFTWSELVSNNKLAEQVKLILSKEKSPTNQYEAFVNANFTEGKIVLIDNTAKEEILVKIKSDKLAIKNVFIISTMNKTIVLDIEGDNSLVNSTFYYENGTQAFVLQVPKGKNVILNFQNILEENAKNNSSVIWALTDKIKATYSNVVLGRNVLAKQNDIVFLDKDQEAHIDMTALHAIGGSRSETKIKCILKDNAKESFDGMIKILPKAQGTDSYLEANSMLLSENAKSINIPKLEIEADDVKATHAATVEHIEEDKMFYLETRGLKRIDAERIIISSFLEGNLNEYPDIIKNKVKEIITAKIETK